MRSYDVRIDVTGHIGLDGRLETTATVWLPDRVDGPLTVMIGFPGGGYTRRYYDIQRLPGYSQAEYHTDRGLAFVACDHLGVGESSRVDIFDLTFERMAVANHVAASTVVERLRAGTLAEDVPPVDLEKLIGMGQSMGGCLLTVQQARHHTFDGIALLGWSGIHSNFASPDGGRIDFPTPPRGADLRALADQLLSAVAQDEATLRFTFHAADEEPELVEADLASSPAQLPPWRTAAVPACAASMMAERVVAEEAAAIDVPVLIACGEIDVVPDPWAEPSAYRGSRDVAVYVVPRMAHMHNFARTRELLWDRIASFASSVKGMRAPRKREDVSDLDTEQSAAPTENQFAHEVRASVSSGEISGAVAAVATNRMSRMEAVGFRDQASRSPMELDTIFRVGSMAKTVFAAAALILLEEKKFGLDDSISRWVPELANRRVLRTPSSEVADTVPARREISVFDVLTFQLGIGMYLAPENSPLLRAMRALGVAPVTEPVSFGPDEFMSRLGSLPLAHHPGETFMYHTGDDVLRVLISRVADQPLGEFLHERVFEPLAMVDSGLSVPEGKRHRFSTCYSPRANAGESLAAWDEADGRFAKDPIFPNQLVSTAGDYVNFAKMLLGEGSFHGRRFLSSESVALMMTDHLSDEQKRRSPAAEGFWQTRGWGMGATVYTRSIPQGPNVGSYSWFGGYGGHFIIDRKRGSAVILMIPRIVQGSNDTALGYGFELDTYRDVLCAEMD